MTMTNAEWMVKNGYKFDDIYIYSKPLKDESLAFHIRHLKAGIDEISSGKSSLDALIAWLDAEHVEPILDDAEKRYLSAVIRPFRDRVWYIMKSFSVDKASCYIFIRFNDGSSDMEFPVFRKSDMYKGMKICKAYTPEELGL